MTLVHLNKTPAATWCGVKHPGEVLRSQGRADFRSTKFATEATCLRCLQLAVVGFEKSFYDAKYGDAT